MQLANFDPAYTGAFDMTQAYQAPGQEYMNIGEGLQELNEDSDYSNLNQLEQLQDNEELNELWFDKVGDWLKNAGKKVADGVKKGAGAIKGALGFASNAAEKVADKIPEQHQATWGKLQDGLSKASSWASQFKGLQELEDLGGYTAYDLAALHEAGFDLNELFADDMTPEMHELFFNKVGKGVKTTKKLNTKARPFFKKRPFGSISVKVSPAVARLRAMAIKKRRDAQVKAAAPAVQPQELFEDELEELTAEDFQDPEILNLIQQDGEFDLNELDNMDAEEQELFFKKIGRAFKKVGSKIGNGFKKAAPVLKKVGKVGEKVLDGVAKAAPIAAPIAGMIPIAGPALSMGLQGAAMASQAKNTIKAAVKKDQMLI